MAPIAVTMGEPAGIGPELALLARRDGRDLPPFFVFADPQLLQDRAIAAGLAVAVVETRLDAVEDAFRHGLPVVPLSVGVHAQAGRPDPATAPAVIESIDLAAEAIRSGAARAMVTAPIAKDVLYRAAFAYPGHTEYLGALAQRLWGARVDPVMMIWSDVLAVVPVTIHIPLSAVPGALSTELIVNTGTTVAADLRTRFGLDAPRLAVAGLNPHAGESGALGHEDE